MPSLQQHLAEQPPTTSGVHEAMARHAEHVFEEFHGILPLFLGKRTLGPFINLTLPNAVTENGETVLETLSDLILVYDLRLVSFVSAVRIQNEKTGEPALGALLVTTDRAKAYFQLPWELSFDDGADIIDASRSASEADIIPPETRAALFAQEASDQEKQFAYERLVARFGGSEEIPEP